MRTTIIAAIGAAIISCAGVGSASALSSKDCSVKYQAAKQAGSLNGQKWSDFRKAECGPGASSASTVAVAPNAAAATPATTAARPAPSSVAAAPSGAASYPSAVDPKYAKESAGKARRHTCLDAYKAAKASGTLGDARWIQKGGGYYSTCNAHLKGA